MEEFKVEDKGDETVIFHFETRDTSHESVEDKMKAMEIKG